ncbi:hypothetical protein GPECTOR_15g359 [Gonium pectorale]|uniref:Uncharacterized protein n=1 Tax=Gonium pectorale TaxID=33097 RepID=A0A150GLQ2_GONPE|nr:hypothetical protein GPECTOR_15g359 [Gonium pectorale]|eukprot:KXZ50675.1 hypothetical protein GPECTOR_15g359 [Gonium pectorale]
MERSSGTCEAECFLLSVDVEGGCCLWDERSGRCVLRRAVPELAAAAFADMPRPEPFCASWLLAALPGARAPGQSNDAPTTGAAARRSAPACAGSSGSAAVRDSAGGESSHGGGGSHCNSSGGAEARPPVALVLDWRSLTVVQVLPMAPLQQLLPPELCSHAFDGRPPSPRASSSGDARDGGKGPLDGDVGSAAAAAMAAAGPAASSPAASPGDALLCVRVTCCSVPGPRQQLPGAQGGEGPSPGDGLGRPSVPGGERAGETLALVAAVTAAGTLCGCVVPCDPYRPPAWALGAAAPSCSGVQADAHEPLLAAALSKDLGVALLGAADAWLVLQARREQLPPWPPPPTPASPSSGRGPANQTQTLRMSYVPTCRISLMHQRPAGWRRPPALAAAPAYASHGSGPTDRNIRFEQTAKACDDGLPVSRKAPGGTSATYTVQGAIGAPPPDRPAADAAVPTIRAATHLRLLSCSLPPPVRPVCGAPEAAASQPGQGPSSQDPLRASPLDTTQRAAAQQQADGQDKPMLERLSFAEFLTPVSPLPRDGSLAAQALAVPGVLPPSGDGSGGSRPPPPSPLGCQAPEERAGPLALTHRGTEAESEQKLELIAEERSALRILGWDGSGRQQVVEVSAAGEVLAVEDLPAPPPPPQLAAGGAAGGAGFCDRRGGGKHAGRD